MADGKRIVIVGGVAGGASAAARARRLSEQARVVLLERGAHVSFANCGLPYHIGGAITDRDHLLVQTPQSLHRRFNIEVRTHAEVLRIDRGARQVLVRDARTGKKYAEPYDALILSPGAEPVRPPIPGIDHPRVYALRNLTDMDAIQAAASASPTRRALVIGGGYIGLEMAEALRQRGWGVSLVEVAEQVFGAIDPEMAEPVHRELRRHGVDLRLRTSVAAIHDDPGGLRGSLSDGTEVLCGLAILAVGVRPEVTLARQADLRLGPSGGIAVDEHLRTSDPAIFAVGDAVETADLVSGRPVVVPLAGPASRQGRIAADNALGRSSVYRATQGTAICKVFNLAVGITGLSEKALHRAGLSCQKVHLHPASHAEYYPGAAPISLKLLFDPDSGKVLGAQAVGTEGVDKRIDVLAVALRAGMTVFDLEELELAYAPPYGSAKDPVNYAGFAAANVLRGDVRLCHAADLAAPQPNQIILDVRTEAEFRAGAIPGAVHLAVDDLRGRLGDLPRDKEILAYCESGLRSYLACRILSQHGPACRNLSGGYKTYLAARGAVSKAPRPTAQAVQVAGQADPPPSPQDAGEQEDRPQAAGPAASQAGAKEPVVRTIDCTHMQCPGPILKLSQEMAQLQEGQAISILTADPGFAADVQGWCRSTGHRLIELKAEEGGRQRAVVAKAVAAPAGEPASSPAASETREMPRHATFVVFSGELDRAMASFVIANGAAAMGSSVTMFFTFWGLSILRRHRAASVRGKSLIEKMFGWMMPRGAGKLKLSRMNMGGLGTAMMKGRMRSKNVPSLPELIDSAQKAGVKLVACAMSVDVMGLRKEELIDGVEFGGVASFLSEAHQGNVTLFI